MDRPGSGLRLRRTGAGSPTGRPRVRRLCGSRRQGLARGRAGRARGPRARRGSLREPRRADRRRGGTAPAPSVARSCTTRRRRRCSGRSIGCSWTRRAAAWARPGVARSSSGACRSSALSALAALQLAIVGSAADAVRPGGRLVYAVCTFTRAETDAVCDALLRRRPDLDPIETDGPDGPADPSPPLAASARVRRHVRGGVSPRVVGPPPLGSGPLDRYHCAAMGTVAASILAADFADPRGAGRSGRAACRRVPRRHHGRPFRAADRAGHGDRAEPCDR